MLEISTIHKFDFALFCPQPTLLETMSPIAVTPAPAVAAPLYHETLGGGTFKVKVILFPIERFLAGADPIMQAGLAQMLKGGVISACNSRTAAEAIGLTSPLSFCSGRRER